MTTKTTHGPLWAYVIGGVILLPFLIYFTTGLLDIRPEISPVGPSVFGGALGWVIWRMLARRK